MVSLFAPFRLVFFPLIFAGLGLQATTGRAQDAAPLEFTNPGFEEGLNGWTATPQDTAAGLSTVTADAAHSGKAGLLVKQDPTGPGSWLQSSRVPIESGKSYRLNFWVRVPGTSGVGVWVQFLDEDHKSITVPATVPTTVQIPPSDTDWTETHLDLAAPAAAAFMTVAVHAYSKHECNANFDDFSVVPIAADSSAPAATTAPKPAPTTSNWVPPPPLPALDPARIKEIASYLDATPTGIGPSIDNRPAWEALAADAAFKTKVLARAEQFLNEPSPVISAELWMNSARTANRTAEPSIDRRRFRLVNWVLAEGMENKGRFLPSIEKEIAVICAEPTWVLPAHDPKLLDYNGTEKMIDLGVGMTSWTLATADSMLGSHLSDATRKLIRDEEKKRVFDPYLAETHGQGNLEWWRTNPNNWNAVVHAGVCGAALALDDSLDERAEIVASVEKEIPFYLNGFPKDGYSLEGMGYWKYGFGHFIMLSEALLRATHGKLDLYADEKARLVAQFPRRFELVPIIYPAFADAAFNDEPSLWLYHIIDCRYGLGDQTPQVLQPDGTFAAFLYSYAINMTFDSAAPPVFTAGGEAFHGYRIRDWFKDGQVLVDRPTQGQTGLSLAFKGGTNGASHGHNDLGSFLLTMDKQPLLVDPGATPYGSTTFSVHRYENQIISSYGHSVPKVAGQLQKEGAAHFAEVVDKTFTDADDSVTLNLTKGYDVPELTQLTRHFDYSRADQGKVTIADQVQFTSPQAFGTALVTFGDATEEKPGVWSVTQGGKTVRVAIDAGNLPFTVTNEMLTDVSRAGKVRRLGIDLNSPTTSATILLTVTPETVIQPASNTPTK